MCLYSEQRWLRWIHTVLVPLEGTVTSPQAFLNHICLLRTWFLLNMRLVHPPTQVTGSWGEEGGPNMGLFPLAPPLPGQKGFFVFQEMLLHGEEPQSV